MANFKDLLEVCAMCVHFAFNEHESFCLLHKKAVYPISKGCEVYQRRAKKA